MLDQTNVCCKLGTNCEINTMFSQNLVNSELIHKRGVLIVILQTTYLETVRKEIIVEEITVKTETTTIRIH